MDRKSKRSAWLLLEKLQSIIDQQIHDEPLRLLFLSLNDKFRVPIGTATPQKSHEMLISEFVRSELFLQAEMPFSDQPGPVPGRRQNPGPGHGRGVQTMLRLFLGT